MRILLAEYDASVRAALRVFFRAHPEMDLAAEAANLADLLAEIAAGAPDVVILDWDTLGTEIDPLLSAARRLDRQPAIIAISVRGENRKVAMEAGADGFAHKGEPPERLLEAVRVAGKKRDLQQENE